MSESSVCTSGFFFTITRGFSFLIIFDASVLLSHKSFESASIVFSTQLCLNSIAHVRIHNVCIKCSIDHDSYDFFCQK